MPELTRLRQTVRRGPDPAATLDHGPTNNESAPHGCRCGAPLCVDAALGLVLVGWLLAVLPFAEHARGDRERGVDERDLDLPVTVGSPA